MKGDHMLIETKRLLIRDIQTEDAIPFVLMAADGGLIDVGFDKDCGKWMSKWIAEAKEFAVRDNPATDYLAYVIVLKSENKVIGAVGCSYYEDFQETGVTYFIDVRYRNKGYAVEAVKAYVQYFFHHYTVPKLIATVRAENIPSWKVAEKTGFVLTEKRMYQDLNDDTQKLYHFYVIES